MFAQSPKPGFFERLSNLFPGRKLKREQLEQLRSMLSKAVSDGVVTDEETKEIESFYAASDLTKDEFDDLRNTVLNDVLSEYCSDRRVSPDEVKKLKQMAIQLGFNDESLKLIDDHVGFFSLMHHLETCSLEQLPTARATGVILQPQEIAYVSVPGSLMEERVVKREIVGRSHGISIPIVKGVMDFDFQ
jgi:hypothetical protein